MQKVINRRNVLVLQNFGGYVGTAPRSFTYQLHLGFNPDTLTVKQISYASHGNPALKEDYIGHIRLTNVNEYIGSLIDGDSVSVEHVYSVANLGMNDLLTFEVRDPDEVMNGNRLGALSIMIEFTKHE
jgi:hypothetical protein